MAKTKEYKRETVLAAATELFWRKGYNGTSMNDLVAHTGINKKSMYNEFGDKENFFITCLTHYIFEDSKEPIRILNTLPLSLSNVETFLDNRIEYALSADCYGCLLVNSVIEKETLSENINEIVYSTLSSQEQLIKKNLKASMENGEISSDNDIDSLTTFMACFFRGLMTAGKGSTDKSNIKNMRNMMMSAIQR